MSPGQGSSLSRHRWWAFALLWVVVICWWNAPRLTHSLWNDEEATARTFVVGHWQQESDGKIGVARVPWVETFFNYSRPTNHILFSVLARCLHDLAPAPTGPEEVIFVEPLLRMPSFVAGVAALGLLLALGQAVSRWKLGLIALVLLSLHPLFTRYSTEARGYGLLFALVPLQWLAAVKGVSNGRWHWWALLALAGFLSMWVWPMAVYLVLPANVCALLLIATASLPLEDRFTLLSRWFICHGLAVAAFIQAFLPNLVQLRLYMKGEGNHGAPMDAAWVEDALCYLFTGSPWFDGDPANPLAFAWSRVAAVHPVLVAMAGTFLAGIVVLGLARLVRGRGRERILLLAWLLPLMLIAAHGWLTGSVMLAWYFAPALPGLMCVLASGVEAVMELVSVDSRIGALTGLVLCAIFGGITHERRTLLREHSPDPNREAALLARKVLNPWHPGFSNEPVVGGFHKQLDPYVAGMVVILTPRDLHTLEQSPAAVATGCCVIVGNEPEARQLKPEIMALLADAARWECLGTIWGTEAAFSRTVYRKRR